MDQNERFSSDQWPGDEVREKYAYWPITLRTFSEDRSRITSWMGFQYRTNKWYQVFDETFYVMAPTGFKGKNITTSTDGNNGARPGAILAIRVSNSDRILYGETKVEYLYQGVGDYEYSVDNPNDFRAELISLERDRTKDYIPIKLTDIQINYATVSTPPRTGWMWDTRFCGDHTSAISLLEIYDGALSDEKMMERVKVAWSAGRY